MALSFYRSNSFSVEEFVSRYCIMYDALYFEAIEEKKDDMDFGIKCWKDNPDFARMTEMCPFSDRELTAFGLTCRMYENSYQEEISSKRNLHLN